MGSTVLKLWLFKDQLQPPPLRLIDGSFSCHNLNSMDPISMILQFSESLKDTFQMVSSKFIFER